MKSVKLFISYSHKDEEMVEQFLRHLAPLKNNYQVEEWYDRKIQAGERFQDSIDNSLDNADVVCLMISSNFLSSSACLVEKDVALSLQNKKGLVVMPVILSPCLWSEHKELNGLLAAPTDGKAVSSFIDPNEAWHNVVKALLIICESLNNIRSLRVAEKFNSFLQSVDILTKSHQNKEVLKLDDIFVFPKMKFYDSEEESHRYNGENLTKELIKFGKIIIAGENQSGKTTLCKRLFYIYRSLSYIPVYLEDENKFLGNTEIKLQKAFKEQYDTDLELSSFDRNRVVPILDNFHLAKYQEKYIEQYGGYSKQVLIVDDLFGFDIRRQSLIKEYQKFKIREFTALERNELITKWIQIKEDSRIQLNRNHLQQSIDEKTELVENSLGIIFGKGIMPSYPFFVLSLLAAHDTQKPLDSDITSQGHCYQALIYLYLKRQGVKNDQIDIYSNFLAELAFNIHKSSGRSLSSNEFDVFLDYYKGKYNLPIPINDLIKTLSNVNICKYDSLNQFYFCYSYIYYFFVAKYLSEHIDSETHRINNILANLHQDENAYITVFITHHTKSNSVLEELLLNAEIRFEGFKPASLDTDELAFFDEHEEKIIKALLPSSEHNAEEERRVRLAEKAEIEEGHEGPDEHLHSDENNNPYSNLMEDLRLSIKTVEVMGLVIKNRSGSLDIKRLEYIFEQGLKVHLRILTSFIEIIGDEFSVEAIVDLINDRISNLLEEMGGDKVDSAKIKKIAKMIFWNLNFGVLHAALTKAIHSLGSSNLLNIAQRVCERENTPAAFIVNHGIKMWYAKNLRIDEIAERMEMKDFSKTARALMKLKVVEHCKLHKIDYADLVKIEKKLNIPFPKMLATQSKGKK